MEIIVQGKGVEYFSPNETIFNITFKAKGQSYEEVLNKGIISVENFINEILLKNGFNKEELKTRNFLIREERKYNEGTRNYEFDGYSFNQNAILKFDYDKEKIANIMNLLSKLNNAPICQINFGVKNEKECKRKILAKAYNDALEQAEAIAIASGKTLKQCVKVDFKPFSKDYISPAKLESEMMYRGSAAPNTVESIVNTFTPEDIELTEVLYCLWIAE